MRFLLIHGTGAGAWCWDRVVPVLEKMGHTVLAIDLPGHGTLFDKPAPSFATRSEIINAVLEPGDVLVGHSAGGYDITIAADREPHKIGHLLYLAAGLPLEGQTIGAAMHGEGEYDPQTGEAIRVGVDPEVMRYMARDEHGRLIWTDPRGSRMLSYEDASEEVGAWAFANERPAATVNLAEIISVPHFWRANLPRSFIMCMEDRVLPVPRARLFCRRLGVEPLTIEASHSPYLSRPDELARLMVEAVGTTPIGPLLSGNPAPDWRAMG